MDRKLAIAGLLSGLCVSAILAPKDAYFIPNLMFFWLSQLAVLVLLWPFHPRPAVVAGVALPCVGRNTDQSDDCLYNCDVLRSVTPCWRGSSRRRISPGRARGGLLNARHQLLMNG